MRPKAVGKKEHGLDDYKSVQLFFNFEKLYQKLCKLPNAKSLRETHHWKPGQEFVVMDTDEGILLKPKQAFKSTELEDIANRPPYQGKPKTIEEMNAAVDEEIIRKWQQ